MDIFNDGYWPTVNPAEFRQAVEEFDRTAAHAEQTLKSNSPLTLGVAAVNRFFSGDEDFTLTVLMRYAVLQKMASLPAFAGYVAYCEGRIQSLHPAFYEASATFPYRRDARIDGSGLSSAATHLSMILNQVI